jgi:hypothetical protein
MTNHISKSKWFFSNWERLLLLIISALVFYLLSIKEVEGWIIENVGLTFIEEFNQLEVFRTAAITFFTSSILFIALEGPLATSLIDEAAEKFSSKMQDAKSVELQRSIRHAFSSEDLPHEHHVSFSDGIASILKKNAATINKRNISRGPYFNVVYDYKLKIFNDEYFLIECTCKYDKFYFPSNLEFICTDDRSPHFESKFYNTDYEYVWVFLPNSPDDPIDYSKFNIDYVSVGSRAELDDDKNRLDLDRQTNGVISFKARSSRLAARSGSNRDGSSTIRFKFSVLQGRRYASFSTGAKYPGQNFKCTVDATDMPIDDLTYFSAFTSENAVVRAPLHKDFGKIKSCEVDGWFLSGSHIIFSWNETKAIL